MKFLQNVKLRKQVYLTTKGTKTTKRVKVKDERRTPKTNQK